MSGSRLTIYFDLDGTILDVRRRYYVVYTALLAQMGSRALEPDQYWHLRRQNAPARDFLPGLDSMGREVFAKSWLAAIEASRYLELDELLPGVRGALRELADEHRLVLVTLRRSRERLLAQIRALGLDEFFSNVLTTSEQGAAGKVKGRLIKSDASERSEAIVVGDSEADVQAARFAGLPVACVCSGIRDRDFIAELAPDAIIDSVTDLPDLLTGNALAVAHA